jgi:hypothetical protein
MSGGLIKIQREKGGALAPLFPSYIPIGQAAELPNSIKSVSYELSNWQCLAIPKNGRNPLIFQEIVPGTRFLPSPANLDSSK